MISSAIKLLLIVLYTVIWASIACVLTFIDRTGEGTVWVARIWVRWILATCGVSVDAVGLENIPLGQPAVYMSNHVSHFDVAAIIRTLPVSWRFVAKRELTRIPFFGWALLLGGHVIVDRGNRAEAVASLKQGARQIREGTNVIIFPEGTRSETGEMGEFKSGGFHLACEAQVPIVPVSVYGSRTVTPKSSMRIHRGRISVVYGVPIATRGSDADRAALKEQVRKAIRAGLDHAAQRASSRG